MVWQNLGEVIGELHVMQPTDQSYGRLLQAARRAANLSHQELAYRTRLDSSHLYRIEKGLRGSPRRGTVLTIARALGLDAAETNRHLAAAGHALVTEADLGFGHEPPLPPSSSASTALAGYKQVAQQASIVSPARVSGEPDLDSRQSVVIPALLAALRDPDGAVRREAAAALGRLAEALAGQGDGRESSSRRSQEAILGSLAKTMSELPPAILPRIVATLSSYNDTLQAVGALLPAGADLRLHDAGTSPRKEPGPIEVCCIPIAGWQWSDVPPPGEDLPQQDKQLLARIAARVEEVAEEAELAGILEVAVIVPVDRIQQMRDALNACSFATRVTLYIVGQASPLGLGHAVLQAQKDIANRPFAVLLPDDQLFVLDDRRRVTVLAQLVNLYAQQPQPCSLVALARLTGLKRAYGLARLRPSRSLDQLVVIEQLIEKPPEGAKIWRAPASQVQHVLGRYILQPSIFPALAALGQESRHIELTDGLQRLIEQGAEPVLGCALNLKRVEVGIAYRDLTTASPPEATEGTGSNDG